MGLKRNMLQLVKSLQNHPQQLQDPKLLHTHLQILSKLKKKKTFPLHPVRKYDFYARWYINFRTVNERLTCIAKKGGMSCPMRDTHATTLTVSYF